ncbi:hypothetical protein COHA_003877 [Chlorella ohadii]|uniref:Uncharacterized protein n=1 Tax=Chlorella ohadii TaxID=2649997 RepID=A0AAD5H6C9_9CHLO|nr:hypothetical protein COHA_003877 [Chlorella ohadii]
MKEARHEGKRGTSYVDLVQRALSSLPDRRGTVYEIQAVLKRDCASCLDKYQTPKGVRWKLAVSEVLRDQQALFEAAGKTASGKIVWRLRDAPAAG